MFMEIYHRSLRYFSSHVFLNSMAHSAGGFGLAVVLQEYIQGNAFLSVWIGWVLIAFSTVIHIRSMMK